MLNSLTATGLTTTSFFICTGVSLLLGILLALLFMYKNVYSRGLVLTLALLPVIVQLVIMMVNGSVGAGVAVAGTFSLVRFRSQPGTARDILSLFIGVAIGIAVGMGYAVLAVVFFAVVAIFTVILVSTDFGNAAICEKELRITIPEDLDYEGIFDDIFTKYTSSHTLERVKTSNMGTLYELKYHIVFKDPSITKSFLDEIRCRNGNLNVSCGMLTTGDTL